MMANQSQQNLGCPVYNWRRGMTEKIMGKIGLVLPSLGLLLTLFRPFLKSYW